MHPAFRLSFAVLAFSAALVSLPAIASAQVSQDANALPAAPLPAAAYDDGQHKPAAAQQTGSISGTVIDTNDDLIPGATVTLQQAGGISRSVMADDNAAYKFDGLPAGVPFQVVISAKGFVTWTSPSITLTPGQFYIVTQGRLAIAGGETSVTVSASSDAIAVEQIHIEEQQRILGFIPNFYVVYDPNPVPMPTKLKYKLAWRVLLDPVNIVGAGALAGMEQAGDTPNFPQGAKGYGERFGAVYADGFTDLMIGGAILPAVLHQDPRYYYQGTGTHMSRALHAMAAPFVCKGDNGRWQPNFSSLGGDLISASISNLYYPPSNRGATLVFSTFLIDTGERVASTLVQEFVIRKLTPSAKRQTQ